MGQQEYEAFKAKLREWMNTHPDEYAAFEEAMNARDYAGCQSVIFQAMSLIPWYRRLMSDKANEGLFEHVDEIEQAARQHDLAGKIIRECEQPGKDSTLPAMLCWLYFGKSFERMVERCEELRRSPDLGFLQKMTMSATIRLLISRSIKLELRTKQDWDAHREAMRLAESDRVLRAPLSEALWFLWKDNLDDNKPSAGWLDQMQRQMQTLGNELGAHSAFAEDAETLFLIADSALPNFSGGNGRYRYAKAVELSGRTNAVLTLAPRYENTAMILDMRGLHDACRAPLFQLSLDNDWDETAWSRLRSFLYYC